MVLALQTRAGEHGKEMHDPQAEQNPVFKGGLQFRLHSRKEQPNPG